MLRAAALALVDLMADHRARRRRCATSAVSSLEASSTTITSAGGRGCCSSALRTARATMAGRLNAGITTLTGSGSGTAATCYVPPYGTSALEITIFERLPPAEVVEPWRALAVEAENPFALPEWLEAWCAAHPEDRAADPRLPAGRRRRSPAWSRSSSAVPGGAASCSRRAATSPTSSPRPARRPTRRAVADAVARALPRGGWELWRLERCPGGSPWSAAAAAAGADLRALADGAAAGGRRPRATPPS